MEWERLAGRSLRRAVAAPRLPRHPSCLAAARHGGQTAQNQVETGVEEAREIEKVADGDQQLRDRIAIRAGPITACG
jgi:hypothetical protein